MVVAVDEAAVDAVVAFVVVVAEAVVDATVALVVVVDEAVVDAAVALVVVVDETAVDAVVTFVVVVDYVVFAVVEVVVVVTVFAVDETVVTFPNALLNELPHGITTNVLDFAAPYIGHTAVPTLTRSPSALTGPVCHQLSLVPSPV